MARRKSVACSPRRLSKAFDVKADSGSPAASRMTIVKASRKKPQNQGDRMAESGLYVYVSQQGEKQISVYRMSPAGELDKVQDVSVTGKAMPMAVSPDRRFLFIALRTEPYSIASFAIDGANGTLTHLGNGPAHDSSPYISTDRTGRFL